MTMLFDKTRFLTHKHSNLKVNAPNTTKYGSKSLRSLGPHIWNSLPERVKEETNPKIFKEYINQWFGPSCKCSSCANP